MCCIQLSFALASLALWTACHVEVPLEPRRLTVSHGLQRPESAVFAPSSGNWYVSNIGGEEQGDGYISRLDRAGRVLDASFVTGLDDPKGLALDGDLLYVTDVTSIVRVRLSAPAELERIVLDGAMFLNDVAIDPTSHTAYVSDTFGNTIFQVRGSEGSVLVAGEALESPNGLWVERGGLLVGTIGPGFDPETFMPERPGRIMRVDLRTGNLAPFTERFGSVDGIARLDANRLLASDTFAGVFVIEAEETPRLLIPLADTALNSTADFGVDHAQGRILIPDVLGSGVALFDLF